MEIFNMLELMISMTIWGTLGVFVLWSQLPAIEVTFYRCLIGAFVIGCCLIKSNKKIKFNDDINFVILAGILLVLNWLFLFKSFQISTITIGNISYYLQPIILIILGIFIYKEKVSIKKWSIILLALCGVLLTIDINHLRSPHVLFGVLFALIAALLYSFLTILMKRVNVDFFIIIFIQLVIGILILFPFTHFHALSIIAVSCLFSIGLLHTVLAYFFYYNAIKKINFTQIAILSYVDPIVAIISDVIFFNRQLNFFQIAGVMLTFFALYWLVGVDKHIQSSNINSLD
jgi:drug/metabolite transporter (DMT)-like permease